jgi:hypothetical protein
LLIFFTNLARSYVMKRRDFVITAAAGIAAVTIPSYYYFFRDDRKSTEIYLSNSLMLILDPEQISALGKIYLDSFPKENHERTLLRYLKKDSAANGNIEKSLEENIVSDFRSGNTIMLDGWILSMTEARQCALFSKLYNN